MTLFHFGKKKNEEKEASCSGCACGVVEEKMVSVKVLGAGCKACHNQYENVKTAIENLEISVKVEYITDMEKIMEYGIMSLPAILINEKVVSMGKVLKSADVEKLLTK